jgi:hypothetical protein
LGHRPKPRKGTRPLDPFSQSINNKNCFSPVGRKTIFLFYIFAKGIPKGSALWRVWAEPKVLVNGAPVSGGFEIITVILIFVYFSYMAA